MSTVAQARSALVTAVSATDELSGDTGCIVFSNGSDLTGLGGDNIEWGFNVTCWVGARADSISTAELAAIVQAKLVILRALAGWSIESVGRDTIRQLAGADRLAADIAVTTVVTLT